MDANAVLELIDKIGGKLVASSSRDGFCEMVDTKDGDLIDEMGKNTAHVAIHTDGEV